MFFSRKKAAMPCAIKRDDTHVSKGIHLTHIEHHMNVTEIFLFKPFFHITLAALYQVNFLDLL